MFRTRDRFSLLWRREMLRTLLILVPLLVAGCAAAPDDPVAPTDAPVDEAPMPTEGPAMLVDAHSGPGFGFEFDVLCESGGGVPLPREENATVSPAHTMFVFTYAATPGSTGVQIGYALDGGDITWLPTVTAGERTEEVEIPPGANETAGQTRWVFWFQQNVEAAPQDCYTGFQLPGRSVTVEAR